MKFARLLRTTAESLPELQILFQDYKQLKKELKKLPSKDSDGAADEREAQQAAEDEAQFVHTLSERIQLLNDRFLEREETCIIQLEQLEAQTREASTPEQRADVYKRFVDFHGEVLLLVHWSVLAYTATVKILKKHHKRTGLLVRAPHLGNLLSQPFCSTEMMTGLARKAELCIQKLAGQLSCSATSEEGSVAPEPVASGASNLGTDHLPSASGRQESVASVQRVLNMLANQGSADSGAAHLRNLAQQADDYLSDSSESEAGGGHSMDPAPAPQPSDHQPMDHATSHGITSGEGGATTSAGTSQPSCPQRTECTLLHKTQVALTMWEQLKKTASTPSTVLDLQRPLKRLRPEDTADSAESGDEASDGESK